MTEHRTQQQTKIQTQKNEHNNTYKNNKQTRTQYKYKTTHRQRNATHNNTEQTRKTYNLLFTKHLFVYNGQSANRFYCVCLFVFGLFVGACFCSVFSSVVSVWYRLFCFCFSFVVCLFNAVVQVCCCFHLIVFCWGCFGLLDIVCSLCCDAQIDTVFDFCWFELFF